MFAPPKLPITPVSKRNILENAVVQGGFQTFARAVEAAGMLELLSGPGPFTVFAPTDEAFAQLPKGALARLLKPEHHDELVDLVSYHVMTGRKTVAAIGIWDEARTVQGQNASIKKVGTQVSIDGAQATPAPMESSNGFLHGLDRVVFPAATTA